MARKPSRTTLLAKRYSVSKGRQIARAIFARAGTLRGTKRARAIKAGKTLQLKVTAKAKRGKR